MKEERRGPPPPTRHGHPYDEARSALHKSIRRGLEVDALYWASQLAGSYPHATWRALSVIASEDVGLAEPLLPAALRALRDNWYDASEYGRREDIYLVHAVLLLARAKKSRITDHAYIVCWRGDERREVPDYAIDQFTARGKAMGRGHQHFVDEGSLLADPDTGELTEGSLSDPYRNEAT
jgi:replication-associated recombination protein RarA